MTSQDLLPVVLDLPSTERAALAYALLQSLHGKSLARKDAADILVRRAQEVADGTATLVDPDEALDRIAQRLQDRPTAHPA